MTLWQAIDDDDFVAYHHGLAMRVEQMSAKHWWWCVSDVITKNVIASSHSEGLGGKPQKTAALAKRMATNYTKRYIANGRKIP